MVGPERGGTRRRDLLVSAQRLRPQAQLSQDMGEFAAGGEGVGVLCAQYPGAGRGHLLGHGTAVLQPSQQAEVTGDMVAAAQRVGMVRAQRAFAARQDLGIDLVRLEVPAETAQRMAGFQVTGEGVGVVGAEQSRAGRGERAVRRTGLLPAAQPAEVQCGGVPSGELGEGGAAVVRRCRAGDTGGRGRVVLRVGGAGPGAGEDRGGSVGGIALRPTGGVRRIAERHPLGPGGQRPGGDRHRVETGGQGRPAGLRMAGIGEAFAQLVGVPGPVVGVLGEEFEHDPLVRLGQVGAERTGRSPAPGRGVRRAPPRRRPGRTAARRWRSRTAHSPASRDRCGGRRRAHRSVPGTCSAGCPWRSRCR